MGFFIGRRTVKDGSGIVNADLCTNFNVKSGPKRFRMSPDNKMIILKYYILIQYQTNNNAILGWNTNALGKIYAVELQWLLL